MSDLEAMVIDLQTRVTFQEDALNQLNDVVTRQDAEMLLLREQLRMLAERLADFMRQPSAGAGNPMDERPPHY